MELYLYALSVLVWRNSQIAEYLADYLATKASGTTAMIHSLRKVSYGEHFQFFLEMSVYGHSQSGCEIIEKFKNFVATLPEQEVERLKRVCELEESKLDASHPPTTFRIAFLENHPQRAAAVVSSGDETTAIDGEMDGLTEPIGRRLIDQMQAYR